MWKNQDGRQEPNVEDDVMYVWETQANYKFPDNQLVS